jgi:hypothetical protein
MNEALGSGRRFRALAGQLAKSSHVKNPQALAASIGRKKFGAKRMAELASRGRQRAKDKPEKLPVTPHHRTRIKV